MQEMDSQYHTVFAKTVRISETDNLLLKRNPDNVVSVMLEDHITCTSTLLANYKSGRWTSDNPTNLSRMFKLFKQHKNLKPALIRFLTPNDSIAEVTKAQRTFSCVKKRFRINILKTTRKIKGA